ncbi:trafficking protein Mon1-domain-containing protein [Chytriomyces sp. MP71]|nr:trafficking protein Mon1-domain-containing protein [Chytriomyces sp. MP71]
MESFDALLLRSQGLGDRASERTEAEAIALVGVSRRSDSGASSASAAPPTKASTPPPPPPSSSASSSLSPSNHSFALKRERPSDANALNAHHPLSLALPGEAAVTAPSQRQASLQTQVFSLQEGDQGSHSCHTTETAAETETILRNSLLSAILEPLNPRFKDHEISSNHNEDDAFEDDSLDGSRVEASADADLLPTTTASFHQPTASLPSILPVKRKHFFVLSNAGKAVYSRYGSDAEVTELMGVLQTLFSIFEHDACDAEGDTLESFRAGAHLFVFQTMGPLYLVVVAATSEAEDELKRQLLYIHDQIISVTTQAQITRIFEKRSNYDLRQLLTGTDIFLSKTITSFRRSHFQTLSATPTPYLSPKTRLKLKKALATPLAPKHLLHALLASPAAPGPLACTDPGLHPRDAALLTTLLRANGAAWRTGEGWIPLCLPALDARGFVHVFVRCVVRGDVSGTGSDAEAGAVGPSSGAAVVRGRRHLGAGDGDVGDVFVLAVSRERESFFEVREWGEAVAVALEESGVMDDVMEGMEEDGLVCRLSQHPEVPSSLRHFVCRARKKAQYAECGALPPYTSIPDYERLQLLYQVLYSKMYPMPGQLPAKIVFVKGVHESIFALVTTSYDIFAAFHPLISKREAEEATRALYRWIKRMDSYLFS